MVENVNKIMRKIKEEYDRSPENWRVLRGRDKKGHYDTFVLGNDKLWHLKTEWKTPYLPVGVGERILEFSDKVEKIITEKGEYFPIGEIYPQAKSEAIIAIGIGKYSPKATKELKEIIRGQEALENKLSNQLNKLLKKEELLKEYY
ncbi:MAG: hypothetical protein QMD21_02865 [Candidatus Thermoplasmatota archaeon]|nr:hypothetical protein [Candidatus Thermoplasmatota archaeon]